MGSVYFSYLNDIPKLESLEIVLSDKKPYDYPVFQAQVICSIPTLKTLKIKGNAK